MKKITPPKLSGLKLNLHSIRPLELTELRNAAGGLTAGKTCGLTSRTCSMNDEYNPCEL